MVSVANSGSPIGAVLQTWDHDAVSTLYNPSPGGACTAPSISRQPSDQTITSGQQANLSVLAAGTAPFTYLWYTGTPPSGPVAPGPNNNAATYNPAPHFAYLGANNGVYKEEDGSWPGLVYRNVWIGRGSRPQSLGSALARE